jgi:hypothetical protein
MMIVDGWRKRKLMKRSVVASWKRRMVKRRMSESGKRRRAEFRWWR